MLKQNYFNQNFTTFVILNVVRTARGIDFGKLVNPPRRCSPRRPPGCARTGSRTRGGPEAH